MASYATDPSLPFSASVRAARSAIDDAKTGIGWNDGSTPDPTGNDLSSAGYRPPAPKEPTCGRQASLETHDRTRPGGIDARS